MRSARKTRVVKWTLTALALVLAAAWTASLAGRLKLLRGGSDLLGGIMLGHGRAVILLVDMDHAGSPGWSVCDWEWGWAGAASLLPTASLSRRGRGSVSIPLWMPFAAAALPAAYLWRPREPKAVAA